jgi:hypothetical protein
MEDLIHLLENCKVDSVKFDDGIELLISNLQLKDYSDESDKEWETISENYSKLKHIHRLINYFKVNNVEKFKKYLNVFLEEIDKTNQYYLRELNWECESFFLDKLLDIKNILEISLNINDPFEKLDIIIKAYFMLLPIIEYYRKEKFVENINDTQFLNDFKKRKYIE